MKPTAVSTYRDGCPHSFDHPVGKCRRFPITDYNYQPVTFGGPRGRHLRTPARSFWNIANNYLKDEARHEFWTEATLFAFIIITAALSLMNNLHALIEFLRAVTSH